MYPASIGLDPSLTQVIDIRIGIWIGQFVSWGESVQIIFILKSFKKRVLIFYGDGL